MPHLRFRLNSLIFDKGISNRWLHCFQKTSFSRTLLLEEISKTSLSYLTITFTLFFIFTYLNCVVHTISIDMRFCLGHSQLFGDILNVKKAIERSNRRFAINKNNPNCSG